jgi:hypothetical protein
MRVAAPKQDRAGSAKLVSQVANTGAPARHAATTRRASAELDHGDRNVANAIA